jgi:hypothetical protein
MVLQEVGLLGYLKNAALIARHRGGDRRTRYRSVDGQ